MAAGAVGAAAGARGLSAGTAGTRGRGERCRGGCGATTRPGRERPFCQSRRHSGRRRTVGDPRGGTPSRHIAGRRRRPGGLHRAQRGAPPSGRARARAAARAGTSAADFLMPRTLGTTLQPGSDRSDFPVLLPAEAPPADRPAQPLRRTDEQPDPARSSSLTRHRHRCCWACWPVTSAAPVTGRNGADARFNDPESASPPTGQATSTSPTATTPSGRSSSPRGPSPRSRAGAPGYVRTADGTGAAARFSDPCGIASDGAGNLYVADTGNYTIRKIVIATGEVTTFAGTAGSYGSADGDGRGRPLQRPDRHRQRRGRQPLRRRHATTHHPESRDRDRRGHHVRRRSRARPERRRHRRGRRSSTPIGIATTARATSTSPTAPTARSASRPRDRRRDHPRGRVVPGQPAPTGPGADAHFFGARRHRHLTGRAISTSPTPSTTPSGRSSSRPLPVTTFAGAAGRPTAPTERGGRPFLQFTGIVSDGTGNLYVADTDNSAIRRSSSRPAAVTTLAGAGWSGNADGTGAAARQKTRRRRHRSRGQSLRL